MPPPKAGHYMADIEACPRCAKKHARVNFTELRLPSKDYNYFARCPDTNEPILAFVEITIPAPIRTLDEHIEELKSLVE